MLSCETPPSPPSFLPSRPRQEPPPVLVLLHPAFAQLMTIVAATAASPREEDPSRCLTADGPGTGGVLVSLLVQALAVLRRGRIQPTEPSGGDLPGNKERHGMDGWITHSHTHLTLGLPTTPQEKKQPISVQTPTAVILMLSPPPPPPPHGWRAEDPAFFVTNIKKDNDPSTRVENESLVQSSLRRGSAVFIPPSEKER